MNETTLRQMLSELRAAESTIDGDTASSQDRRLLDHLHAAIDALIDIADDYGIQC